MTTQTGDPITTSVAAAIRAEMGIQDISVPVLARRSGLYENTLRNYLREGRERDMPVTALAQISEGLGISFEDILERAREIRSRRSSK